MAGRLVVATLGFHEHFALRLLNRLGAGHGDYVAAVTVKPPRRGRQLRVEEPRRDSLEARRRAPRAIRG
ncbi:MAG: hypothetical protein GSR80_000888 [Desulfurococcales archaeon]|nr:hypothetical protein [Desulfurococcales archaeon]